tara:strand:+ start:124 stop:603 length:480 start_codon:yes stop_codon:yes gene_type:complete
MAQPMRVCDRTAIVDKIKREWKETSLNRFKHSFEGSDNEIYLKDRLKELETVTKEMKELEKDFNAICDSIESHCENVNNVLADGECKENYISHYGGTSLNFDNPYTYNSAFGYEIRTHMSYILHSEIESELALATIGGDFDVKELIKDLTDRFINQNRT